VSDGNGQNGGDSWFLNSSTVLGKGGQGGRGTYTCTCGSNCHLGGAGGTAAAGIGDVKYSGGSGGNSVGGAAGGGGSSAGTAANGATGGATSGGTAPTGGGNGGRGYDNGANQALAGSAPGGGGGGGAYIFGEGKAGAAGRVVVSYTP
jgi:hypothetical protein